MKIRVHRVEIAKKRGQILSWFTGKLVDYFERVGFSHTYVEIIDEFGVPFAVDNLTGSYVRVIDPDVDPKVYYDHREFGRGISPERNTRFPGGSWRISLGFTTHRGR